MLNIQVSRRANGATEWTWVGIGRFDGEVFKPRSGFLVRELPSGSFQEFERVLKGNPGSPGALLVDGRTGKTEFFLDQGDWRYRLTVMRSLASLPKRDGKPA